MKRAIIVSILVGLMGLVAIACDDRHHDHDDDYDICEGWSSNCGGRQGTVYDASKHDSGRATAHPQVGDPDAADAGDAEAVDADNDAGD